MRSLILAGFIITLITSPNAEAQDKDVAQPRTTLQFSGELVGRRGTEWRSVKDKTKQLSIKPASDEPTTFTVAAEKTILPNNHVMEIRAENNETIVVQLLAGEISIKSPESNLERNASGTWVVKPGETQLLKTEDDAAILRITRLGR